MTNEICNIVTVGKRRDGKMRYWCLNHKANATGKYGVQLEECAKAHIAPLKAKEIHTLDIKEYPGGVALWGAIPAVYDTTHNPVDRGIHLHARKEPQGKKIIDQTFKRVNIIFGNDEIEIEEEDAIYYMTSVVMGHPLKYVECNHCGYPHLDKDVLAVHKHRKHLCASCGREFYDNEVHIGNPLIKIKEALNDPVILRPTHVPDRMLEINQKDYPGGIQIWGSNQAILWNSSALEEEGIHVHCYKNNHRIIDDTYSKVIIDGIELSSIMVRNFMGQAALPHLRDSLVSLNCPKCNTPHFDIYEQAYTAHIEHCCHACGLIFTSPYRKKKTISNPIISMLETLENNCDLERQSPFLEMIGEGRL